MSVHSDPSIVSIKAPVTVATCYHCQEPAPQPLQTNGHDFCCRGCLTVYELLASHDLCQYYQLDPESRFQRGQGLDNPSYAWLDDEEVQEKLLDFKAGNTAQVHFHLPNIHCSSCLWLLEKLPKLEPGVKNSCVNFVEKSVSIQFDLSICTLRKLATLLAGIGYAPEFRMSDLYRVEPPKTSRRMAYQLGVAGFAVGNIMLFSFPEYLGLERQIQPQFSQLFGYISLALALPVLFYSASDFFRSAWRGVMERHLNIDVPLVLGMLMLFLRSTWEILGGTGAGYLDSFAGLVFLMLIGRWFQQISWNQLSFERDYRAYFPVAVTCKKNGEEKVIPLSRLEIGDTVLIHNQEIIPADGILLKGEAQIDYSFVSGESEPVPVKAGDKIYAGGRQIGETLEIGLSRLVSNSYLSSLWNQEAFKSPQKGTMSRLADQAGKVFTWLILAAGLGALLYWLPRDTASAINAFTAVMIVACPCNIVLSIPFTLGNILRILGHHGLYLKNIQSVEAFSGINAVVFDKTGTITQAQSQALDFYGENLKEHEKSAIRSLTRHSNHPLSRRLAQQYAGSNLLPVQNFEEILGKGICGVIDGQQYQIGSAAFCGMEGDGLFLLIDNEYRGHFKLHSRFRFGLEKLLQFFRQNKYSTWLISGDSPRASEQVATFFPDSDSVFFQQSPNDKLRFVKKLQQSGQRVMMLGDGLNDAGALQQSDLGIVLAEDTNNFTPACDGILHADAFHQFPKMVQLASAGVNIVRWSYAVALTYNFIGLSYALSASLSPLVAAILMPISSVSVVLFGVLLGNWQAYRLGLKEKITSSKPVEVALA
jgi:P-type Cu+ transporter